MTTGADFRATTFPLVIPAGSDIAFTVTATSDTTPVDLSAATIAAVLYDSTGDPVTPELSTVVSGAGSNVITLSLTDTQTAALTGVASWVLWVTRGGDKRPWMTGPVQIVDPTSGVRSTDGDAVTLTVDSDVNVSISVLAVGGSGGGASTLEELTDVTVTTPVNGNVLGYDGSGWVNTTPAGGGDLLAANNLSDVANTSTARTNLGVAIGTNVQAYSSVLAATTASFTTADETKLDGVEALADVTDTANVTAAGALMDSEVDADIKTLSLPANTTISAFGATLIDDAAASNARTTLGLVIGTNVQAYDADLSTIAAANNGSVLAATTASYTTAEASKLAGIEAGADVTDTTNVTAAGALMDSEVDADLKTLSLPANTTISAFGASLVDDADASTARSTLGLVIGTNVQAYDADLADIAAISDVQGDILVRGASGWERLPKSATSTDVLTAGASQPTWAAASGGGGGGATVVMKTSNEIVNTSNTLQDDNELLFAIGSNETWVATAAIFFSSLNTADLKVAFTAPAGATITYSLIGSIRGADGLLTASATATSSGSPIAIPTNSALTGTQPILMMVAVSNSSTAGNVVFQWSQDAPIAADTTVFAGSYLIANQEA